MATTPHKHAEVIKAWADGKQIQSRNTGYPYWFDCSQNPTWDERNEYRVKPETIRYRVGLFRSMVRVGASFPLVTHEEDEATEWEASSKVFIRWLTDWVEVEV